MSVYKDNATGKWRVIYRYTDITGKRREKLIKVLARLSYKKVHCQPKCKAVFYLNNLNQTKYLTGIVKPKSEKSGLKSWIF